MNLGSYTEQVSRRYYPVRGIAVVRRPNLFIVGAMKSGTTSLHKYLSEHPEICMSSFKEPSYFLSPQEVKDVYFEAYVHRFWRSESAYLSIFKGNENKAIIGESSTNYTKMNRVACVAEKIYDYNQDAKLIYLMRDPTHRTISHYFHELRRGEEKRTIIDALSQNSHYIDTSDYAFQIRPFLNLFGRERVLFLTTEAMQRDPQAIFRRVCDWLGVDASFVPPSLGMRVHVTPEEMMVPRGRFGRVLIKAYHIVETTTGLREPPAIRAVLQRIVKQPTPRSGSRDAEREAIRFLRPIMQEKVAELVLLAGREFPEWPAVAVEQAATAWAPLPARLT